MKVLFGLACFCLIGLAAVLVENEFEKRSNPLEILRGVKQATKAKLLDHLVTDQKQRGQKGIGNADEDDKDDKSIEGANDVNDMINGEGNYEADTQGGDDDEDDYNEEDEDEVEDEEEEEGGEGEEDEEEVNELEYPHNFYMAGKTSQLRIAHKDMGSE